MINLNALNANHLDFFRELESIGAGHAATALSKMLGGNISLRVPSVNFYEFSKICDKLGGPENLVVSVLVEMTGDLTGFILLVQNAMDARALSNKVLEAMGMGAEESEELLTEMQISSLMEVSNILSGAYLSAISNLTGLFINAAVPRMVIDMAGAVMNLPAATYGEYGDVVLFLETEFIDMATKKQSLNGQFLLVPDAESFTKLLKTMGIE